MVAAYYRYSSVFVKAYFWYYAVGEVRVNVESYTFVVSLTYIHRMWIVQIGCFSLSIYLSIYLSFFLTNAFADTKEVTKLGVHDGTLASAELVKELRQLATFW